MSNYELTPERETKLSEARKKADRAKELQAKLSALADECVAFLPLSSWSRGRKKRNSWPDLESRLSNAASAVYWLERQFESEDDAKRKKAEDEAKKKAEQEKAQAADLYRQEAILWLQEHGKKLGEDFTLANAAEYAEELAFNEEVERLTKDGGWHDFGGQNCNGPCAGWDGTSRRCECGNRRVSWERGWGHTFKEPYVYGEAY